MSAELTIVFARSSDHTAVTAERWFNILPCVHHSEHAYMQHHVLSGPTIMVKEQSVTCCGGLISSRV